MQLSNYSIGIGDRFGHQGVAQLAALQKAAARGVTITPVWNKSHREHQIIGSSPTQTRHSADAAVKMSGWRGDYFVDADHIGLQTVAGFVTACDYFTLDVADEIGRVVAEEQAEEFIRFCEHNLRPAHFAPDIAASDLIPGRIRKATRQYLGAVLKAAEIYHFVQNSRQEPFVLELSLDETHSPQQPCELLLVLAMVAWQKLPLDTLAPKFCGRFNKGVDYRGDIEQFAREFEQDIRVIRLAIREFGLKPNLKLSVHSGSDKFALYPVMRTVIQRHAVGLHLKTAGTTWLEELHGLAVAGGAGLRLCQMIYEQSYQRFGELTAPYAAVLDIDPDLLPRPEEVKRWNAGEFIAALHHDPAQPQFNPHLRQLLHVGYKVAAELGATFLDALKFYAEPIAERVSSNLFNHLEMLYL